MLPVSGPSLKEFSSSGSVSARSGMVVAQWTRAGASPGLLTRRYSVPETVMRKYKLAAQSSMESRSPPQSGVARGSCGSLCECPPRRPRRDIEPIRRSALLRRMWARAAASPPSVTSSPIAPRTPQYSQSIETELPTPRSPSYEVLEIVVSETVESSGIDERSSSATQANAPPPLDLDRYVSDILVESLNSLSDQLESMSASMGGERRISIVEKEIKVKLQNAGVNTIVHLSPTSNNQIIFGNEELCHKEDRHRPSLIPFSPPISPPTPRISELHVSSIPMSSAPSVIFSTAPSLPSAPSIPSAPSLPSPSVTSAPSSPPRATAAPDDCNRAVLQQIQQLFRDELQRVPHPAPESLEVRLSSDEETECCSLVDSLDDPTSPRIPLRRPLNVLDLLPETSPPSPPPPPPPASFFIPIDGKCEETAPAPCLPDRIRARLLQRQRRRELRAEGARRDRERERYQEARRRLERDSAAMLDLLLEEIVLKVAQEEIKCASIKRDSERVTKETRRQVRGKLSLRPARRLYRESEIRDGDDRIEILEILEYADASGSSPEVASDEGSRAPVERRSRIPVPIYERIQRSTRAAPARTESRRTCDVIPEERSSLSVDSGSPRLGWPRPEGTTVAATGTEAGAEAASSTRSAGTQMTPRSPPGPANPPPDSHPPVAPPPAQRILPERLPPPRPPPSAPLAPRSSSSDSGGGDSLCPPRCLVPRRKTRKKGTRVVARKPRESKDNSEASNSVRGRSDKRSSPPAKGKTDDGGWSVTLCGGGRSVLPRDVEMRLRFPSARSNRSDCSTAAARCPCPHCAPHAPPPAACLTLRKRSTDSSILASKSTKRSADALPELETYRASRSETTRSVEVM